MSRMRIVHFLPIVALLAAPAASGQTDSARSVAEPGRDLLSTARALGSLGGLLDAFERAGMQHELSKRGPFTLFAPTDEALAALEGPRRALVAQGSDPLFLRAVLRHHLVNEALDTSDLRAMDGIRSMEGPRLRFGEMGGVPTVDGIAIKAKSIRATNGVLHLVDGLLVPPAANLMEVLEGDDRLTWFARAVRESGLEPLVGATRPITVFAPTDEHFRPLVEPLLAHGYRDAVRDLVRRHLATGRLYTDELLGDGARRALDGGPLGATRADDGHRIAGVRLLVRDRDARNGTVHLLDGVLPAGGGER